MDIVEHLPGLNVMVLLASILILCRLGIYGKGMEDPGEDVVGPILRKY